MPQLHPIHFEPNLGQASVAARYVARNTQCTLELCGEGLTLISSGRQPAAAIRVLLRRRARIMRLVPERFMPSLAAYYLGSDASRWRTRIPNFGAVRYQSAYSGIDWLIQGSGHRIEQEFILAPHAQLSELRLAIADADRIELEADGGLMLEAAGCQFRFRAPIGHQLSADYKLPVGARFVLDAARREIGLAITSYPTHQLVIDPVLVFSTSVETIEAVTMQADRAA